MHSIFLTPFEDIQESDLLTLVENGIVENRWLEYKSEISEFNGKNVSFLTELSAFANSSGGDLIVGIAESEGKAIALPGLAGDANAMLLKYEQWIASQIQPRIPDLRAKIVQLSDGQNAIIFRVGKSFVGPHRVQGNWQFYKRGSQGKQPMEMEEIRRSFLEPEGRLDIARRFHNDRISAFINGQGLFSGFAFRHGATIFGHMVPLSFFPGLQPILIRDIDTEFKKLNPPSASSYSWGTNVDGRFNYAFGGDKKLFSINAIHRNASAEFVRIFEAKDSDDPVLYSPTCERTIVSQLKGFLRFFREVLKISPPFIVMISIVRGKGFRLHGDLNVSDSQRLDRDVAYLSETIIEDYAANLTETLRNTFDSLSNAFGLVSSPWYSPDGEWRGGTIED